MYTFRKKDRWPGGCILLICVILLFVSSCIHESDSKEIDPVAELPKHRGWMPHKDNPIIKAGDHIMKGLWNDPCVIKQKDRYIMYMTSSTKEPFKPPVLPFRAVSSDGVNWMLDPEKPLLDTSGTPFVSIETPNVITFKGKYHMYYSGIYPLGSVPAMAIGHATSDDGIIWQKDSEPVLSATGNVKDWNGYLVAEPGAVPYNGEVYLYFTALGERPGGDPPQLQTIGLATSDDGIHFDNQGVVLRQSSTYPSSQGFVGYSTPTALVYQKRIHLFYDVAYFNAKADPQWQQVSLHHAVSDNGKTDFTQDGPSIFVRSDFKWTSGEIHAPSVLVDGEELKMWFGGHVKVNDLAPMIRRGWKGSEFGIGYAATHISNINTGE